MFICISKLSISLSLSLSRAALAHYRPVAGHTL